MTILVRSAGAGGALLALAGMLFAAPPQRAAAATITVPVGNYWFCSSSSEGSVCETTIQAGDTVVWDFSGAVYPHTSTACDASCSSPASPPLWDSGMLSSGAFQFTFTQAGTYLYRCELHPDLMQGRIVVQAGPTSTAPPAGQTPAAGATPAATTTGPLPPSGQGPQPATSHWWLLGALGAVVAAWLGLGLAYARRGR